jgi:hypothetical protein
MEISAINAGTIFCDTASNRGSVLDLLKSSLEMVDNS